jgi:predicted flap endonuclease-1-like 5' DNA nuclease
MNDPMKTFLRIAGVMVGLGAAAFALRHKLLPAPAIPEGPPPQFRTTPAKPSPPKEAEPDDLTAVKGIGPARAERLNAAGYETIAALITAGPDAVGDAAGVSTETAAKWLKSAAAL